jgi:hypothetical protein
MQISSTQFQARVSRPSVAPQQSSGAEANLAPSDSVSFSVSSAGQSAVFGGLGLIPVVGFVSNFGIGAQASMNDRHTASAAAGYGALSNLAGTAVTAGGLLFGSDTATKVGLGMLGLSGLAGAYAGFVS